MAQYEQILTDIQADERYQRNVEWGQPRRGHPEGAIRQHIQDLEENLEKLRPRLSDEEYSKLRVLIHTHDTFKPEARQDVAIRHPRSHASLACQFLSEYTNDSDLLTMMQLHDEPYALWHKYKAGKDYSGRLEELISAVSNWDLFLTFLIIDGCTAGKSRDPLIWFFGRIADRVASRVTTDWLNAVSVQDEST